MINIKASLVKELRVRTGAGIMDCKQALVCSKGDIDKSIDFLRKMGQIKAEKKQFFLAKCGSIFISSDHDYGIMLELNCETDFVAKDKEFFNLGKQIVDYAFANKINDIKLIQEHFEELRIKLVMQLNENIVFRRIKIFNKKYVSSYLHGGRIGVLIRTSLINDILAKEIAMHISASNPKYLKPDLVPQSIMEREYKIQLELAMQSKKPEPILEKIIQGRMVKFANENSLFGQNFIFNLKKKVYEVVQESNLDVISFSRFEVGESI